MVVRPNRAAQTLAKLVRRPLTIAAIAEKVEKSHTAVTYWVNQTAKPSIDDRKTIAALVLEATGEELPPEWWDEPPVEGEARKTGPRAA